MEDKKLHWVLRTPRNNRKAERERRQDWICPVCGQERSNWNHTFFQKNDDDIDDEEGAQKIPISEQKALHEEILNEFRRIQIPKRFEAHYLTQVTSRRMSMLDVEKVAKKFAMIEDMEEEDSETCDPEADWISYIFIWFLFLCNISPSATHGMFLSSPVKNMHRFLSSFSSDSVDR